MCSACCPGFAFKTNINNKNITTMKKLSTTLILLLVAVMSIMAQTPEQWVKLEKDVNFYVANDLGRNGYYDQKPIAD